jgi:ATP-dependent protease ClpP protease subunit
MRSYILRHWRGENSLPWAHWINGSLLGVAITATTKSLATHTRIYNSANAGFIHFTLILLITIWSTVGIWRSATNHIQEASVAGSTKVRGWGYAAKVAVVIGITNGVVNWTPTLQDYWKLKGLESNAVSNRFYISLGGRTDVNLSGYINPSSVAQLKEQFDADPNRNALVLDSPGGILISAFDLADFVRKRKLVVAARGKCQSACLLILAASHFAVVTPNTHLMFHKAEALIDVKSPQSKDQLLKEKGEYYRRFIEYGVPSKMLSEFTKTRTKTLSLAEAYNAFLVEQIWLPGTNQFLKIKPLCKKVDCYKYPIKFPQ